ncbi:WD domain, G-beta repeat protein [Ostertagia ostertagi]
MAQIVRQSKFRHVYCKPLKHEQCMSDLRVTEITWDSLFCSVNPKFVAFITKGAGGPFMVIPVNKVGRIDKDYPFVDAHKAPCLEVAWSPFNDNVIASCSEDTTAKVWLIPERGLMRNLTEPVVELCGHQKRVNTLAWHPVANNLLLTAGGENKLLLWNVGTGEALLEIAGHPDQIWCIGFNYDGSQFVTTCKDKKIRILDTRSGEVLHEGIGHEGVKPQRAIFVRDGRIITTGFTKRSERLYSLRAPDNLSQPIIEEELDTSNGVLFPLYDEDTGLVYLCGKGDCAIRYYEVNLEYPYMHYINTYTTSEPQRAVGFQNKRGVNSEENEINRIYKLTTKGVVDVLQFFVPRKSDLFQHDLYPDTRSTIPALTAEEFMDGKNAVPNLMAVNPAAAQAKPKVQVAKKANILNQLAPTAAETASQRSSHSEQTSPQVSAPPSPRHQQQQRPPVVDDDMGIVPMSQMRQRSPPPMQYQERPRSPERNQKVPKQQVNLRSRADRDMGGGTQTAGQRRAAAELERIKRDQARTADPDDYIPSPTRVQTSPSPRMSIGSMEGPTNMEELLSDLAKMKAVMRQHERRIRILEEEIAEKNMSIAYSF